MIVRAGRDCILSCSDMVSAYKNLPVKMEQRCLQVFRFCGRDFVDPILVFGNTTACMWFDRFHHCILFFFVLPELPTPVSWIGKTVDDIPTVSLKSTVSLSRDFVSQYMESLRSLNIEAAVEDPLRRKAFDGATVGEVLGIRFDTSQMTWSLPRDKLDLLLLQLYQCLHGGFLSLHDIEMLHGKLVHVNRHVSP